MEVLNCLAQERGYKIAFFPQQHAIPNHPGAMDDKYVLKTTMLPTKYIDLLKTGFIQTELIF